MWNNYKIKNMTKRSKENFWNLCKNTLPEFNNYNMQNFDPVPLTLKRLGGGGNSEIEISQKNLPTDLP